MEAAGSTKDSFDKMTPIGPGLGQVIPAMLLAGLMIAFVGALGILLGEPCLFPSLGPTVFLQIVTPAEKAARLRNVCVGHALGVACGFLALFLFGAQDAAPALGGGALTASRVAATALAVSLTVALQMALDAKHPPAAATTMLITLGGIKPQWSALWVIALGVGLVGVMGELARRRRAKDSRP